MEEQQEICAELARDFGLEVPDMVSRQEILSYIEAALSRLLEREPERFFQLMYRLDIAEQKLTLALQDSLNGIAQVAELVYQRQLSKISSKLEHPLKGNFDPELDW